jgi:hypothetical protein
MCGYRKEICDAIEDNDNLTFASFASMIGSTKQSLSNFKKGGNLGFRKLLRSSFILFPQEQVSAMSRWCLELETTESIKQAFEYASITRNTELLRKLISKYENSSGTTRECVDIYSILFKFKCDKILGADLADEIENIKTPSDKALCILLKIIEAYSHYYKYDYLMMIELSKNIEKEIDSLNDSRELFLKECFLYRISEIYAPAYLYLNNLDLSRYYGKLMLNANISAKTKSDAYYYIGMSYLLENKEKCLKNLQSSFDTLVKESGDKNLIKQGCTNLNFVKAFYGIDVSDCCPSSIKSFYAARTKQENALLLVNEAIKKEGDSVIKRYYEAVAKKSVAKLCEIYQTFFDRTDFFYASLVAHDLRELGENTTLVNTLLKFKFRRREEEIRFEENFISCFTDFDSISLYS